ncbi:hypothetical protein BB560_001373 [Smittium megazygosporum]|uniref:Small-subunit processome Utp12 domain-containing protein n=1 Tax=Smittium megazygosporum TaxID=133381 RepID=A0A2T9ZHU1_9FUNG|nr:hypothetical protein BB560_001373 [Smittium megazygosporum]
MVNKKTKKRSASKPALDGAKSALANLASEKRADLLAQVAFSSDISGTNYPSSNLIALFSHGIDRDKLRVIDPQTRATIAEFSAVQDSQLSLETNADSKLSIPFNQAKSFTCISWGAVIVNKSEFSSSARKRTKTGKPIPNQSKLDVAGIDGTVKFVAIGLKSSDILIFSPSSNKIIGKLSGVHTSAISDISFVYSNNSYRCWSCDLSGLVVEWDILNCTAIRDIKTNLKGAKKILISNDATKMVVASHSIELWDLISGSVLQTYKGHSDPVKFLKWGFSEQIFFSCSDSSSSINCWDAASVAPFSEVLFTLNAQNDVASLQSQTSDGSVLAITETGSLSAWYNVTPPSIHSKDSASNNQLPNAIIQFKDQSDSNVEILLSSFVKSHKSDTLVFLLAWGPIIKPVFENVEIQVNKSEITKEFDFTRDVSASNILIDESNQKNLFEQKNKLAFNMYSEKDASVIEPADQSNSNKGIVNSANYGPSMEEKLQKLQLGSSDTLKTPVQLINESSKAGKLNAKSSITLVRALAQAINTNDLDMLDSVLRNFNKPDLVYETIAQLPIQLVVPFILQLSVKLRTNFNNITKCRELLPWLKSTFACHTSYLCSLPHLSQVFDDLYTSISQRMQLQKNIYSLKGKCDLLALQLKHQNFMTKFATERSNSRKGKVYSERLDRIVSGNNSTTLESDHREDVESDNNDNSEDDNDSLDDESDDSHDDHELMEYDEESD